MKKIIPILLLLVIAAALVPMVFGLTSLNSGNYAAAVNMLKFYPFLEDKYLEAVRGVGDGYMEAGNYPEAIIWYEQLGDAGAEAAGRAYCADAARKMTGSGSVPDFLSTLDKVADIPEMTVLRDQTILDAAQLLVDRNAPEDAAGLLEHVQQADTTALYHQINSLYFAEAAAVFTTIDTKYNGEEPAAFEQLRQAVDILKNCKKSPLAQQGILAIEKLLAMDEFEFPKAVKLIADYAQEDPVAAGSMLRSIWYCYSHIVGPAESYRMVHFYRNKENIIELGHLTASLSGFSGSGDASWLDALARRADEGDIRRMTQGLYTSDLGLVYDIDNFGPGSGGSPKLLFLRAYLPAGRAHQEYSKELAIDLDMMELLPLEYWPETLEDITHLVVLYYDHIDHGNYKNTSNILYQFSSGYPAIQETGSVRIYRTSDSSVIYESETLTGPVPPASASQADIKGGFGSGGPVVLGSPLLKALREVFPEIR